MSMTRRTFVTSAAAGTLLPAVTTRAIAQLDLGNATITTISDGHLVLPREFLFGPSSPDAIEPILQDFGLTEPQLLPECNVTLYQDGENTVLFDVGSGPDFMPSAGRLAENLDAAGVSTDDITHVVFTHAHPDHIWGLLDEFDDPMFYDATYMMGRAEWDYWWNPETVDTIDENRVPFAVGAKRRMEAIEDSVELFDGDQEILPGVFSVLAAGHTPGHMCFDIRGGGTAAMVVGDAIGNHHMAFRRPDLASGSDQDPETAIKSRQMLFDRLTADQQLMIGFHLPGGGIGHAEAGEDGYVFVPS